MGVINLTPNSFSDGGAYQRSFKNLINDHFDILDFGAESTAPFNQEVSESEEWQRLKSNLENYQNDFKNKTISLDSYKLSTMKKFVKTFQAKKIILNDVSGCLEPEYLDFLKDHSDTYFVYTHNFVPSRNQTSDHMKYSSRQPINLKMYFDEAYEYLSKNGLVSRVIFDPGFGFAKTRDQNILLLKELPTIIKSYPRELPWLIGLSRKSFLRKDRLVDPKNPETQDELDRMGSNIMSSLMAELRNRMIIFRTHETKSYQTALSSLKYL